MKQSLTKSKDEVLQNLRVRLIKAKAKDNSQYVNENREMEAVLSGKTYIERSLMCKNCKLYNRHFGKIKVIKKTQQLERTFICEQCGMVSHIDYLQRPTIIAFKINT